MLGNIAVIIGALVIIYLVHLLWVKNPFAKFQKIFYDSVGVIGSVNYRIYERNVQKSKISKKKTVIDSAYFKLCREILSDLGYGICTVEAFTFMVLVIDLIINMYIYSFTHSTFLFVMGLIIVFAVILSVLFMVSSTGHYNKMFAVMEAEDLIISTIDRGFIESVKINFDSFDDLVKPFFQDFIDNNTKFKLDFEVCMDILTAQLGDHFRDMAAKSIQLQNNQRYGSVEVFKDNQEINSLLRIDTQRLMDFTSAVNRDFSYSLIALISFALLFFGSAEGLLPLVITTNTGRIILAIHLGVLLLCYIHQQSLRRDIKVRG